MARPTARHRDGDALVRTSALVRATVLVRPGVLVRATVIARALVAWLTLASLAVLTRVTPAQSPDRLQWTAPSVRPTSSPNSSPTAAPNSGAAYKYGAPRLIADLPPAVPPTSEFPSLSGPLPAPGVGTRGAETPRAALPGSALPDTAASGSAPPGAAAPDAPNRTYVPGAGGERSEWFPEVARTPAEFPTHLPQDDYPDLPPNLPSAVEDDDLLVVGPKLSAYKNGFFQKLSLGGTWLPGAPDDGLGIVESELFLTVAVPAPKREWPMLITPYLNIRSLDGPVSPDLPPLLYETYLDFLWAPKFTPRWTGILAVAPSVYSSFQEGVESGFRMTGKGLLRYELRPETLHIMAGVLFLNRDDIRLLPAGGILWKPNADIDYEIVFPRPKLAHRIRFTDEWADWWYVAGEFGGNSFAIVRADGSPDQATLRDIRVMFGLERRRDGGAGTRFEIGYVFNRSVEYRSDTPDFHPDDTVLMRFVAMW